MNNLKRKRAALWLALGAILTNTGALGAEPDEGGIGGTGRDNGSFDEQRIFQRPDTPERIETIDTPERPDLSGPPEMTGAPAGADAAPPTIPSAPGAAGGPNR
jgi:hypothetical protein